MVSAQIRRPINRRERFLRALVENVLLAVAGSVAVFAFFQLWHRAHVPEPLVVRYFGWMSRIVRGDFGVSHWKNIPVTQAIADQLMPTIELAGVALMLAFAFGACIGIVRLRVRIARSATLLSVVDLLARSLPIPLLVVFAQFVLVFWVRLPTAGMSSSETFALGDHLAHLVAPVLIIVIPVAAWSSCVYRDLLGQCESKQIRVRDLLAPTCVCIATLGPVILAATAIEEPYFAWPGLGRLLESAMSQADAPLASGLFLLFGGAVLAMKLVAALLLLLEDSDANAKRADTSYPGFVSYRFATTAFVFLGIICGLALFSGFVPGLNPFAIDVKNWTGTPMTPGSFGHLLGTDENGRDLLSRLLLALRTSLSLAAGSALIATIVGSALARLARLVRSSDDDRARSVAGVRALGAYPLIFAPLLIASRYHLLGNLVVVAVIIGLVSSPAMFATFRSRSAQPMRQVGATFIGVVSSAVLLEVTLSIRGDIVDPPGAALGTILVDAQMLLGTASWIICVAGGLIVATLFALNAAASAMRELADE